MSKTSVQIPTNLILFGVTGDLAAKKIIPAIYHLYDKNLLPTMFKVIGFARRDLSDKDLKNLLVEVLAEHVDIEPTENQLNNFMELFEYHRGNFKQIEDFESLGERLGQIDNDWKTCSNKLFYFSVPPKFYELIAKSLSETGLSDPCGGEEGWTRIIVEKPFGKDLETARELDMTLGSLFKEEQIYRIDHYLGKEMLQNVLVFRFANMLLENSWDKNGVASIEIKVPEVFGVENRVNFYDGVGALRDVGQNHLLQMLALTTMNDPGEFNDKNIRKARARMLGDLKTFNEEDVVDLTRRAQYEGYTELDKVDSDSKTETYFEITAFIENDRWKGVPITLMSGKKLDKSDKKIVVTLKNHGKHQNKVLFDLEGDDAGIYIEFWAKKPGFELDFEKTTLSFSLCDDIEICNVAEEYERLLLDCIEGDQTLFVSLEEIEEMWKFIDPIIDVWQKNLVPLEKYEPGSLLY